MKLLYVYDFDKTLVPYDSFRRYLWHLMRYQPFYICYLLLLRKCRIISSKDLKEKITILVESSPFLLKDAKSFANIIKHDITIPTMQETAITLLITASPMVYMRYVVENMNCDILCSDYIDNKYVEMYGHTKAHYLHCYYPSSSYKYAYAISDSMSDICWMNEFSEYEIIKKS